MPANQDLFSGIFKTEEDDKNKKNKSEEELMDDYKVTKESLNSLATYPVPNAKLKDELKNDLIELKSHTGDVNDGIKYQKILDGFKEQIDDLLGSKTELTHTQTCILKELGDLLIKERVM